MQDRRIAQQRRPLHSSGSPQHVLPGVRILSLLATLVIFWMLLSGFLKPLLLGFGAVSCALVVWLSHRMDIVDQESHPHHLWRHLPRYWLILTWESLKSCWQVCRAVIDPRRIQPVMGHVQMPLRQDVTRAILANSVILTPGTLTLEVYAQSLRVHALDPEMLEELHDGVLVREARALEGD